MVVSTRVLKRTSDCCHMLLDVAVAVSISTSVSDLLSCLVIVAKGIPPHCTFRRNYQLSYDRPVYGAKSDVHVQVAIPCAA